jgi:hypothetical protein
MTTRSLPLLLFIALLCIVPMTFLTSPASAQDAQPYAPREYSRSELINFGHYDHPPLVFDFETIDVEQQPEAKHVNFVVTLDADFATVIAYFTDAHTNQTPAARIAPGIMPFQTMRELKVVGLTHANANNPAGFTLSSKAMTRRFTVEVSDKGGRALLTMRDVVMSRLFSGVVPARSGFKPAGAKSVGLLYN